MESTASEATKAPLARPVPLAFQVRMKEMRYSSLIVHCAKIGARVNLNNLGSLLCGPKGVRGKSKRELGSDMGLLSQLGGTIYYQLHSIYFLPHLQNSTGVRSSGATDPSAGWSSSPAWRAELGDLIWTYSCFSVSTTTCFVQHALTFRDLLKWRCGGDGHLLVCLEPAPHGAIHWTTHPTLWFYVQLTFSSPSLGVCACLALCWLSWLSWAHRSISGCSTTEWHGKCCCAPFSHPVLLTVPQAWRFWELASIWHQPRRV